MDLKVAIVIICLCAFTITSTEAGIPKCCITTKKFIPPKVLLKVYQFEVQQGHGACDIPALILHVREMKKPICAHPKVKRFLTILRRKRSFRVAPLAAPFNDRG